MARKSKAPPASLDTEDSIPEVDTAPSGAASAVEASPAAAAEDGAKLPPSQEEQIRASAERKLEERTGDQSVQLSKAEARANGLEGELKKERLARTKAEAKVAELEVALAAAKTAAQQAGTAIAGLPENARQLNECVTLAVMGRGGTTPRRAQVKQSDVLMVTTDDAEVDALQQELGLQCTVYKVSKKTIEELDESGFLHK
jgi:hypothetical protein